jgi:hypothetical protein
MALFVRLLLWLFLMIRVLLPALRKRRRAEAACGQRKKKPLGVSGR